MPLRGGKEPEGATPEAPRTRVGGEWFTTPKDRRVTTCEL